MSNLLDALERQQMLDREKAVVQNLHDRGLCMSDCVICKENTPIANANKDPQAEMAAQGTPVPPYEPGIRQTLSERGSRYGDFDHMADVAQKIKGILNAGASYPLIGPAQREALDVIATKLARIVCGDFEFADSWHDIQGYAKLGEMRCPPRDRDAGDWPPATS